MVLIESELRGNVATASGGTERHAARLALAVRPGRPVQVIALAFAMAILAGTGLLLLPVASTGGTRPIEALFTAVSAICVTGLVVVDTPTHWTGFGQAVIAVLIQIGGFGVMTLASVLAIMISRHLGLGSKMLAAASTRSVSLGDVRTLLLLVARTTLVVEATVAAILTAVWAIRYDTPFGQAVWLGVFHSISAFNNAGFALQTDNLMGFATDPWIWGPIAVALVVGGIGFPVLVEVYRQHRKPRRWSLHTKITLLTSAVLVVSAFAFVLVIEWNNPDTLGAMGVGDKLQAALFQSVTLRTAGFNSIDFALLNPVTWLGMDVFMFIGGGSGGTAGGIKVTTFALLAFVIWAELRGDKDVSAFRWRASTRNVREAITVALLAVALVMGATIVIAATAPYELDQILFEVISAFGTVGLSTGITAGLGSGEQLLLCVLMFVGRLGPVALGTALAFRSRQRAFRYPESPTIIG